MFFLPFGVLVVCTLLVYDTDRIRNTIRTVLRYKYNTYETYRQGVFVMSERKKFTTTLEPKMKKALLKLAIDHGIDGGRMIEYLIKYYAEKENKLYYLESEEEDKK